MKPYDDLACEVAFGMPVCNWRDRATACPSFETDRVPGLSGGPHRELCKHINTDLCGLAISRDRKAAALLGECVGVLERTATAIKTCREYPMLDAINALLARVKEATHGH